MAPGPYVWIAQIEQPEAPRGTKNKDAWQIVRLVLFNDALVS
jgi:hypothetical protein